MKYINPRVEKIYPIEGRKDFYKYAVIEGGKIAKDAYGTNLVFTDKINAETIVNARIKVNELNKYDKDMKGKFNSVEYKVQSLKGMIDSCFTYGSAERDSYNYSRYILDHKDKLGEKLFEKVYSERLADLKANFKIEHGVYTDSEGCSYSNLVKKQEVEKV